MQITFNEFCRKHLDLNERDMLYYSSLPLCALDAVLSIRLNYNKHVIPALSSFCNRFDLEMPAENSTEIPAINDQISVDEFVNRVRNEGLWGDNLSTIIGNFRTAGSNTILKSTAFVTFVNILTTRHINTYQDLNSLSSQDKLHLEHELKQIRGQKVAVDYFFMLAGEKNMVKVDTWLTQFAKLATNQPSLTNQQIVSLFVNAAKALSTNTNPISPRRLDHIAWGWMRDQTVKSNTEINHSLHQKKRRVTKSTITTTTAKSGITELPERTRILKRSIEKGYIVDTGSKELYLFVGKDKQKTYCEVLSKDGQYPKEYELIQKGFIKLGGRNPYYIKTFNLDGLNDALSFMNRIKYLF